MASSATLYDRVLLDRCLSVKPQPTTGVGAVLNRVVIVGALGYFVDVYDLLLFGIVRTTSLRDLGVAEADLASVGVLLQNWQMAGLLIGGILWGVMGDKRGRRSVLFGSIALYSAANLANAFVQSVEMYAGIRFFAGLGLAGELGAAITLVSEALPAKLRGYGTMLVSGIGVLGAVVGFLVARLDWRIAYLTGGVLGGFLLLARISMAESPVFASMMAKTAHRGDLRLFLGSPGRGREGWEYFRGNGDRLARLGKIILIGIPLWVVTGVVVFFSPEIGRALHLDGAVEAGIAIVAANVGAALGMVSCGTLSQLLRSRRIAILAFFDVMAVGAGLLLLLDGASTTAFYLVCGVLGFGAGYWAVFMQTAAEQFGTDLRATVTTAAPNLVRGSVILLGLAYLALSPALGPAGAAAVLLVATLALAMAATWRLRETHGIDLDFVEGGPAPPDAKVSATTAT